MKVTAGWLVPPTSLVVASDDIVIVKWVSREGSGPGTWCRTSMFYSDGMTVEEWNQILLVSSSNDSECRRTKERGR